MNIQYILIAVIVILVILLVGALGYWFFLSASAKNNVEADRKWTDPKFRQKF